ncbi:hypothetical protein VitviT2T_027289 [Vitis vinifera]|nr:hypothetical protein VitviT2T_027289 [Vitis vinifera]
MPDWGLGVGNSKPILSGSWCLHHLHRHGPIPPGSCLLPPGGLPKVQVTVVADLVGFWESKTKSSTHKVTREGVEWRQSQPDSGFSSLSLFG